MTIAYRPEFFDLREWVPPEIYVQRGERAWELLDVTLLKGADLLRKELNSPVIINTWHSAELTARFTRRTQSGFRTVAFFVDLADGDRAVGLEAYAKSLSQHKFGRGMDCLTPGVSSEEVRRIVKAAPKHFGFTAVEGKVSWFHGDTRNCNALTVFMP